MLARTGELPKDDRKWAYEIKWDGVRGIAYVEGGRLRLEARSGRDITPALPGAARARAGAGRRRCGARRRGGGVRRRRPPELPEAPGPDAPDVRARGAAAVAERPGAYVIFDLLWLDGRSLTGLPYTERREKLRRARPQRADLATPANHVGDGAAMLEASRAQGLEGIIAKRLDSTYTPGRRTPSWVKVKNVRRTDVVIGGWLPGEGRRSGQFGALVVGYYEDGELQLRGPRRHGLRRGRAQPARRLVRRTRSARQPVRRPPAAARGEVRSSGARRLSWVWGVDAGEDAAASALPRPARRP